MVRATADSPHSFDLPGGAEHELLDLVTSRLSVVLYRGRLAGERLHLEISSASTPIDSSAAAPNNSVVRQILSAI